MLLAIAMMSIQMRIRPRMMAVIVALFCLPLRMGLTRWMAIIAKVISNVMMKMLPARSTGSGRWLGHEPRGPSPHAPRRTQLLDGRHYLLFFRLLILGLLPSSLCMIIRMMGSNRLGLGNQLGRQLMIELMIQRMIQILPPLDSVVLHQLLFKHFLTLVLHALVEAGKVFWRLFRRSFDDVDLTGVVGI